MSWSSYSSQVTATQNSPKSPSSSFTSSTGETQEKRDTGEGNCSPFLLQQRALATHTQGGAQTQWGELASSCTPSKNSPRKHSSERRQKYPVTFMDIQSLQLTARTLQNQHKIEAQQPETQHLTLSCAHMPLISCFPPHLARLRPKCSQCAENTIRAQTPGSGVPSKQKVVFPCPVLPLLCFDKATRPACKGMPGWKF